MNIAGAEYNLNNRALEVFLSGCKRHCVGCHNPELWDYHIGTDWKLFRWPDMSMVTRVWIMGGDPLDQPIEELKEFLVFLDNYEIWLWTGHAGVPKELHEFIDYAKVGEYIEGRARALTGYGIELASDNQHIVRYARGRYLG